MNHRKKSIMNECGQINRIVDLLHRVYVKLVKSIKLCIYNGRNHVE